MITQYLKINISAPSPTSTPTKASPTPSLTYELAAEKSRCPGQRVPHNWIKTIEKCSNLCKSESTMFIYGRSDTANCDHRGCTCSCEKTVTDGQCTRGKMLDSYHNLYRFVQLLGTDILSFIYLSLSLYIYNMN